MAAPQEDEEGLNVRLRMYDLEEVLPAVVQWEEAIAVKATRALGTLSRSMKLQQTCGWPLISDLRSKWQVAAVPKYDVEGCQGHLYTSVIVVGQSKWTTKEQLLSLPSSSSSKSKKLKAAINHIRSCSGHLLLGAFLGPGIFAGKVGEEVYTGSHLASMEAVASGKADVAAVDCVTWTLVTNARPALANQLRVIGMAPTLVPALPYVVNSDASDEEMAAIRDALRQAMADDKLADIRKALHIDGFQFDGALSDYEASIKHLLSHYVVLPHHLSWLSPQPLTLLPCAQMDEDGRNILMAFKALENFCSSSSYLSSQLHFSTSSSGEVLDKFIGWRMADGRPLRLHFPRRRRPPVTSLSPRNCIGFFGTRPRLHELDPAEDHLWYWRCWNIDEDIVEALDPQVVTAYLTGEVQPGGNAFNLVVLEAGKSPEDFFDGSPVHREAAIKIAPHYYRRLRIHRLCLTSNHEVQFQRTLVKEFAWGEVSFRASFTHPLR